MHVSSSGRREGNFDSELALGDKKPRSPKRACGLSTPLDSVSEHDLAATIRGSEAISSFISGLRGIPKAKVALRYTCDLPLAEIPAPRSRRRSMRVHEGSKILPSVSASKELLEALFDKHKAEAGRPDAKLEVF